MDHLYSDSLVLMLNPLFKKKNTILKAKTSCRVWKNSDTRHVLKGLKLHRRKTQVQSPDSIVFLLKMHIIGNKTISRFYITLLYFTSVFQK